MLLVMAELGGDGAVRRAEIARHMGRSADSLGPLRQRLIDKCLIDKCLIESGARGRVQFTIPGFGSYVLDQMAAESA